jgi:hypothetical protein
MKHAPLLVTAVCLAASAIATSAPLTDAEPLAELNDAPSVTLNNGLVTARIFLPDAERGFYRGTRFDQAGVFGGLSYAGHDFYVPWFDAVSPSVRDFVFENDAVIVATNTAANGPVEEFNADGGALGYAEAAPGENFLKIGVGVLRRIDDAPYDRFHLYPVVDAGRRSNIVSAMRADFVHQVYDPGSGYGYDYTKTIRLEDDQPVMLIEHVLHNTGNKPIDTTVYNHNFLNIDDAGTTAGMELHTAFDIEVEQLPDPALAKISGNKFIYLGTPGTEDRVFARLQGHETIAADYDFRVVQRNIGAGVHITGDRPPTRVVLWSIQPVMSIEPFIAMSIAPGDTFSWSYRYVFEAGGELQRGD